MRHRFVLAALMLAAGSALPAQSAPKMYCPPGAPGCFAMKYALTAHAPGHLGYMSTFSVWLQVVDGPLFLDGFWFQRDNLFGAVFPEDPNDPDGVVIYAPPLWVAGQPNERGDAGYLFPTTEGNVARHPEKPPLPDGTGASNPLGPIFENNNYSWETLATRFMVEQGEFHAGCGTFPDWFSAHFQTCASQGLDGWVRHDIFVGFRSFLGHEDAPATLDAFRFVVEWSGRDGTTRTTSRGVCGFFGANSGYPTDGVECEALDYPFQPSSVPEPATMTLLGTGLAAVGAAVRRRRRAR